MRANSKCDYTGDLSVFFNGKKHLDCIEADEEAGYIWASYRDVEGKMVSELFAERGALIYQGAQVIKLHGHVEFKIDAPEDEIETIKRIVEETFVPIVPTVKGQHGAV